MFVNSEELGYKLVWPKEAFLNKIVYCVRGRGRGLMYLYIFKRSISKIFDWLNLLESQYGALKNLMSKMYLTNEYIFFEFLLDF